MLRNIDISDISDGKKYSINDMARVGCSDCSGCSKCCSDMGDFIILDPYDAVRLCEGTGRNIGELLQNIIELTVVDGVVLPGLNVRDGKCHFLDCDGRCSVHEFRPSICRMFPLGRIFENGTHYFFLQKYECPAPNKTKVQIKKWLGEKDISFHEKFTDLWHYFLKDTQEIIAKSDDETAKRISLTILNEFYLKPYSDRNFLGQVCERINNTMISI